MSHLNTLGARVTTLDTRTVKPQPKQTDPHYLSPEHRVWRKSVCDRAGWRCEWIDERGQRCANLRLALNTLVRAFEMRD